MTAGLLTRVTDRWCVLMIVALAFMLSTTHHNILGGRAPVVEGVNNVTLVVRQQLDIVAGKDRETAPDAQTRVLVALAFFGIFHVSPWSWAPPTFLLGEGLAIGASLLAMFYLGKKVTGNSWAAMLAVGLMALYVPLAFSGPFRVGETLLFGIYCAIAWATLEDAKALFLLFVLLGSLQRPDMSASGAGFGVLYLLWERREFRPSTLAVCAAALVIPFAGAWAVTHYYNVTDFSELTRYLAVKWKWNLKDTRILVLLYLPLVVLASMLRVRFERIIQLMLLSLAPWLLFCVFFCNFSETRHFFAPLAVVIIGIVQFTANSVEAKRATGA